TDMLPETNARKKSTIANKSYLTYINDAKYQYEHQYVRNMLHVNNGLNEGVKFSEIGQLAGIHQTEWSWSPLFADFDNDGFKDLIITNGFPRDVTDKDFANYRSTVGHIASLALLEDSIPVVKIPNYVFRNKGDLTFEDVTAEWGFSTPSFSNGAAFADLDNDGDLDYVINNINSEASVYRNTLYHDSRNAEAETNNFLRIKLVDNSHKKHAIGARVKLFADGTVQYYENNIYRGFLSSVENVVHFGLGQASSVDSVIVQWSDGNIQTLTDPTINRLHEVEYHPTMAKILTSAENSSRPGLVSKVSADRGLLFKHEEDDKIDFNVQRTLPHKFTQSGPGIAVGDINGDRREDVVIGGSTGYTFSVFVHQNDGSFRARQQQVKNENKSEEDTGVLLFDADNDKDLDLYLVSGSMEHFSSQEPYQDRLYINDGRGNFRLTSLALPDTKASGSCVRAADFDSDGDLDLFIGGRMVPGQYPAKPESYLLLNDGGVFKDVASQYFPELKDAGMITDAVWTDFNGDQKPDLIAVGEFTSIMFFANENHKLKRIDTGIDGQKGWWNSIAGADFDMDGDVDYVVGNLGLNNPYHVTDKYPLTIVAKDFDGNESMDAILGCYMRVSMESDEKKLYPVHFWDELNTQSPKFRNQFSRYRQYGKATMNDLLSAEDRVGAIILEANRMTSVYVENLGHNKFRLSDLPAQTQVAPVNGMVTDDVNGDGFPDIAMVGNDYGNEVFAGRYDAFTGLILLGDGDGNFAPISSAQSGFYVPGDAKALVKVPLQGVDLFIASQNRDSVLVYERKQPLTANRFTPEVLDTKAELIYADGKKQIVEFYYGSGYLSQSTRTITVPRGVREMLVYNSRGESRKVPLTAD
ncbi:MAG TPA: VCBS repeat-containing protein, partial [Chryseosolibacter sp.]|nr:VCBS repeat-containing protein [Chryseosolibacter sp.]